MRLLLGAIDYSPANPNMRTSLIFLLVLGTHLLRAEPVQSTRAAADVTVETLVCIRHGEKPVDDLGQLSPQGLRRALALPEVLTARFGAPDFVFAAGPQHKIRKNNAEFSYVRALTTIEPTAIAARKPVNASFGFDQIDELEKELLGPAYRRAVVFVAWEHHYLRDFLQHLVSRYNGGTEVPAWPGSDFDSIYVVKITCGARDEPIRVEIRHEQENLHPAP